jgi:hypothetical protein
MPCQQYHIISCELKVIPHEQQYHISYWIGYILLGFSFSSHHLHQKANLITTW